MKQRKYDNLMAQIYDTRVEMGAAAAKDIGAAIKEVLLKKEECNMIFAAAPSQNEVLASLAADESIEWNKIRAFHMDEYCGLDMEAPQAFGKFLDKALFEKVPFKSVSCLRNAGNTPEEICKNYSRWLNQYPVDIVCLGIGENGHIAFNDPPVADFHDDVLVKVVELDQVCRNQQVNDGCFATIDDVPTHAVTLTIPALCRGKKMFCVVPGILKADAVKNTCEGPIGEVCPATALRHHMGAILYLDRDSASKLD